MFYHILSDCANMGPEEKAYSSKVLRNKQDLLEELTKLRCNIKENQYMMKEGTEFVVLKMNGDERQATQNEINFFNDHINDVLKNLTLGKIIKTYFMSNLGCCILSILTADSEEVILSREQKKQILAKMHHDDV